MRVKGKQYHCNEHYFDIIDCETKAYWLGLLYSDGNISKKNHCVSIGLIAEDEELLKRFNQDIQNTRPIVDIEYCTKSGNKHIKKHLAISSKLLSDRLTKLGCVQAKSLILEFPTEDQVPKHLLRHWLRGMWDGDGSSSLWYCKNSNNTVRMSANLTSTYDVCIKVKEYLDEELNLNCIINIPNIYKNTAGVNIYSCKNVIKFYSWLYNNSSIYMKRKFDKFQTHVNILTNRMENSTMLKRSIKDLLCL